MPRRILEGKVVSDKQDKTVTVLIESRYMHPIYKKYLRKSKKFSAHDENNTVKEGETVRIIECAPISKNKRWTVYTGQDISAGGEQPKATKPAAAEAKKAAPAKKEETKAETKKPAATAKKAPAKKPAAKKDDKK